MTRKGEPAPAFTSIRRVSPTQEVREQLLAAIQRGDYLPGTLLPSERMLCEAFGVSRVSVREALAGLESTGLIRVEHGKGAFVRDSANDSFSAPLAKYLEMHSGELVELLKVRGALDELAAVEATKHADAGDIERLRSANDAFRHAAESPVVDYQVLSDLDVAFHLTIAQIAAGELLPDLLAELNEVMAESRRILLSRPGQTRRSVDEHRVIIDAIAAGDASAARRAVQKHLGPIREWLGELRRGSVDNGRSTAGRP